MLVQLLQMNLHFMQLIKLEYHKVTSHQSGQAGGQAVNGAHLRG